jgi:class 3 adenylate cyclase/tetratricopeptide (TPR) repeat protein
MSDHVACPSCGADNPGRAKFCMECAAPMAPAVAISEERKTVTSLFCDLVSFTAMSESADPEDVDRILSEYFDHATKVIESHGGTVEKFIGDAVVGVFGVPAVHEDDPERAVRAALRILESMEGMKRPDGSPLQARCGVNTGEALVRLDVDPASGRGFLTGDAVNVAARLQAAAPPNGVTVGNLTHELSQRTIVYEEAPPVAAKGKAEALPAWLAKVPVSRIGIQVDRARLTPLVDRAIELPAVRDLVEQVFATSTPQLVLLVGEPGIGKTRLVQELFAFIDARREMIIWRQGRCPSYGEGISFWALTEIVKAQAGILENDEIAVAAAKLEVLLPEGSDRAWLLSRLKALIGLEAPAADREENFAAWTRFLEGLATSRPTVLVLEDLHWADEGLLAFVEHLIAEMRPAPLLLIGTARRELLERHPQFATPGPRVRRMDLGPLERSDAERLIASLIGGEQGAGERVAELAARTAGNPFFAEESARLLTGSGYEVVVPASVQAVLAARLDGLAPEHKALLSDAAVLGEVFWDGAVAALGGRERAEAEATLDELATRQLVQPARTSTLTGEREWTFVHALARDVAYAALPRRARAQKHVAAGIWLEERAGERLDEVCDALAHHYTTALDLARAVCDTALEDRCREPAIMALKLAGERALRLDVEAAERQFTRAVELSVPGDACRPDLLLNWSQSLQQRGRYEEAGSACEEAAQGFLDQGRKGSAARALTGLDRSLRSLGRQDGSRALDEALALTADEPEGESAAIVMQAMAVAAMNRGDYAEGDLLIARAVDNYARLGMEVPIYLQGWKAQADLVLGRPGAIDKLLSLTRDSRDAGTGYEAAIAHLNASISLFPFTGSAAFDLAEEGVQIARTRGVRDIQGTLEVIRAWGMVTVGRWSEALAAFDESHDLVRGDPFSLVQWWAARAEVLNGMGRNDEALELAERVCELVRQWDFGARDATGRSLLVLTLVMAGRRQEAVQVLTELAAIASCAVNIQEFLPALMRCAVRCQEVGLAEQLLHGQRPGVPLADHAIATGEALISEARGEHQTAAAGFADAGQRWHDFGVPYEEAQALLGQGRCLAALGRAREAAAQLAAAREIFTWLGAKPALAETDELLQQIATA